MIRYRITSPEPGYSGQIGTVRFAAGIAFVDADDNAPALTYFRMQGYTIEEWYGDLPDAPVGADEMARLRQENADLRARLERTTS